MKTQCPYQFPLKSREAMTDYLSGHDSYGGWNHPYRQWSPLSWCVKLYSFDTSGKQGDYNTIPEFDSAWEEHVNQDQNLFGWICEEMSRYYTEGEYTTHPGDDQGDWIFTFAGRSGGHMLLESWKGTNFLKDFDQDSWVEWLDSLDFSTLKTLYRAVVCMDQDFTRTKLNQEAEYQINFRRSQWEEEYKQEQSFKLAEQGLEPCPCI